jgi:hypothetical protein
LFFALFRITLLGLSYFLNIKNIQQHFPLQSSLLLLFIPNRSPYIS